MNYEREMEVVLLLSTDRSLQVNKKKTVIKAPAKH